MDEARPNVPSLEMDAWFLEILILIFFFFFENEWGMECPQFANWCMTFENLDIWGKDDFFFFKMDEAWPNVPSLEMDTCFLEILNFFFWKDDDNDLFFFFFF